MTVERMEQIAAEIIAAFEESKLVPTRCGFGNGRTHACAVSAVTRSVAPDVYNRFGEAFDIGNHAVDFAFGVAAGYDDNDRRASIAYDAAAFYDGFNVGQLVRAAMLEVP